MTQDIYGRDTAASYDYIVVGSGSAGSVIAARLAEDTQSTVLLLEAGPRDTSLFIRMPAALGFPLQNDKYNWFLHSEPEPELNNRAIYEARGRVLGGSSSINGMNWVRGNPWDYDNWENMGLRGWSYAQCLPYFKKLESFDQGGNDYRGNKGPMKIETCRADKPLYQAFLAAGVQAGYARTPDHNAYCQEGTHVTQRNVHQGLRWSTSRGYLHQRGQLPNLHIVDRAQATRIVFENKRARAIELRVQDVKVRFKANKEIIVCAGAIHSPHLLLLSGIGNAEHLKALSIPVVHHLPGVGEGLKDHTAAPVQYEATPGTSVAKELTMLGRLKLGAQWLFLKKGLGATNFFEVGAFIRTNDTVTVPNVQFEFIPFLGEIQHGNVKIENGFQYFFSLMRPTSTGRVWLDSADPLKPPKFRFNFLSTEQDRQDAIAAVRAIRRVVQQEAWAPYRGKEVLPGPAVQSDHEILDYLRANAGTNYHPCCTCRMGTDEMAVTDEHARVRGVQGLRVVDASIMPEIVSGNLNAPVIMMAEKIADHIRGRQPLAAEHHPYKKVQCQANTAATVA